MAVTLNTEQGKKKVPTAQEVEKHLAKQLAKYVPKTGGEFTGDIQIPKRTGEFVLADLRDKYPATEKQLKSGIEYTLLQVEGAYSKKDHGHTVATQSAAGFMSTDDKKKLDGIASGAQVNSITGVKGAAEAAYRTGDVNLTAANVGANVGMRLSGVNNSVVVLSQGSSEVARVTVNDVAHAGYSDRVHIADTRNVADISTNNNELSAFFSNNVMPDTDWWHGIRLQGWTYGDSSYQFTDLVGYSGNSGTYNKPLYVRNGRGVNKGSWRKIYDSDNKPSLAELGAAAASHNHDCPKGFNGGSTTDSTWGNRTGSHIVEWDGGDSCAVKWRKNNPSSGAMSMLIDGTVYVNEGTDRVFAASYLPQGSDWKMVVNSYPAYYDSIPTSAFPDSAHSVGFSTSGGGAEAAGFYADGNTVVVYSPCDNNAFNCYDSDTDTYTNLTLPTTIRG